MHPFLAASGLETLITLLVFAGIAAVSSWLKRRRQPEDEAESWPAEDQPQAAPPLPRSPQDRRPAKPARWEEELRRLLEGDEPAPQPPPIIIRQEPRQKAPAPTLPTISRPAPVIVQDYGGEMDRGFPVHLPSLTQSGKAYERASHLDVTMAEHLRQVSARVSSHAPTHTVARPTRKRHPAIALVQDRASLRSTMVASVILGPPRALESQA